MQDTYIIQIEEPILEIGGDGAIAREVLTTVRDVFFVTQPPTVYEILDISTDALILEVNHQGPPGAPGLSSADAAILRYIADVDMGGQRIVRTAFAGRVRYASSGVVLDASTVIGLSLNAALAGDLVRVATGGEITEPTWNFVEGLPVFLALDGRITQVPPTTGFSLVIGTATSPTSLVVGIKQSVIL